MAHFITYYYRLPGGRVPVKDFIDSLKVPTYRKFIFKKELLEEFGPRLPKPHAKHLDGGLYELRLEGEEGAVRILYFFAEKQSIIFVHAFKKASQKTPKKELALARNRMKGYLNR